jgi:hypothetical protein
MSFARSDFLAVGTVATLAYGALPLASDLAARGGYEDCEEQVRADQKDHLVAPWTSG